MPESSLSSEQLPNINPTAEKIRLRREHLKQIGDLAVRDLAPFEDEALVERTRELAIMREIREFSQTELLTAPITIIDQETVRVLPEQLTVVRERLLEFIASDVVLTEEFLEEIHTGAGIEREVLDVVIGQLRQEGAVAYTASGYAKSPTGEDHDAWLAGTMTGPISTLHILRSNN